MSHELRTPFNGMLGMLSLLASSSLDAEQADHLHTARQSATHLLELLNDILDISKLESGRLEISPHALDLHRLLREVHALMALNAEAKHLTLRVSVHDNVPQWVQADGKRLKQILFNLMSNAVKFTDQGEVTLDVAVEGPLQGSAGHALCMVVRDSGIGMDAAMVERLFQRFAQGDASTSRRYGGSGLGLEISRSLARLMGGDITVNSSPGLGSSFTLRLTLPAAEPTQASMHTHDLRALPDPAARAAPSTASATDPPGLDLLVADDHPVNRKFMAILLARLGHRVRLAVDGAQAVEQVKQCVPDLVFMDLHMPVLDGMQATLALRAMPPPMGSVPIIALTADAFSDTRERVIAAGMNNFMAKPVQSDDIEALLTARFGDRARGPQAVPPHAEARTMPTPPPRPLADSATVTQAPASTPARRRFRAADVATNLDMVVIGDLCVGVSLPGYKSVLQGFFKDESGSQAKLIQALEEGRLDAPTPPAHAVKGAAASMGLRAVRALAAQLEAEGQQMTAAECQAAATDLREKLDTAQALLLRMGFL
jgi:hypothetical protein